MIIEWAEETAQHLRVILRALPEFVSSIHAAACKCLQHQLRYTHRYTHRQTHTTHTFTHRYTHAHSMDIHEGTQ